MQTQPQIYTRQTAQTRKLVTIPLLGTVAFLLQYLEFPLPLLPSFLKLDFSTLPALVGGLVFGPVAGVLVELLKNILHFLLKSTDGFLIGEVANFIAGASFVCVAVMVQRIVKGAYGFILGLLIGTLLMTVIMAVTNYFVIMPAYAALYNIQMDALLQMFQLESLWSFILYAITPFNLIKGIAVSLVAYPLFVTIGPRLKLTT